MSVATLDSPDAPAGPSGPRFICFLCRRKFKSAPLLTRHKQLSELHRRNLARQDEEIQQKNHECRHVIAQFRKQLQDMEHSKQVSMEERVALEAKLRSVLGEYGNNQEKWEMSRLQQQLERAGNADVNSGMPGQGTPKRTEVHETRLGRLVLSAGAATWQGNKDVQEDRYILDIELQAPGGEKVIGFCVLDGHSGRLCVDALIDWLPRNLQKCLSAKSTLNEENMRKVVHEACIQTDEEFLVKARELEVLDGSTMILALIYPDGGPRYRMVIGNLGDSRAVLCRAQGQRLTAVRLSDDHKPGRADERKRIEELGGIVDVQGVWRVFTPGPANFAGKSLLWGLAVSRAFGDLLMKEPSAYGCMAAKGQLVSAIPEIHSYELHPAEDRFLILACDGVWDVLEDDDAVKLCVEHRSADLAAHALIRRSFEQGSDDNITAVVVAWQLQDDEGGHPEPGKKARH